MEIVAQEPACLIGLEACSGAHEWARRFQALGHTVKLMAPRFVAPYRKNGKNDGNDAEAICEAVGRPSLRFVPIKTLEQQAVLCLHRVCQGFVEERTATINRLRSTGGKQRLGHITGRGDPYLRTLLVMGASSVLQRASSQSDPLSRWALAVRARRGYHRACIAVAAKNARVV
jgi:transposase